MVFFRLVCLAHQFLFRLRLHRYVAGEVDGATVDAIEGFNVGKNQGFDLIDVEQEKMWLRDVFLSAYRKFVCEKLEIFSNFKTTSDEENTVHRSTDCCRY